LDGQPLNIAYINLPILIPTQDSIQEFKVQTSNLGPEWGKFSGVRRGTDSHDILVEDVSLRRQVQCMERREVPALPLPVSNARPCLPVRRLQQFLRFQAR
jgi:hypothetical protein